MKTRLAQILTQIQVALMLLTRLPAGRLSAPVPTLAQAAWAYPLAGALVGALGAGGLAIAMAVGLAPILAAILAVTICVLATGGLHEDGLADVADGFGGGRDTAQKLEIMRDSRIGSYGTLALVLSLGLRVQVLALVAQGAGVWGAALALIAIEAVSRAGLAGLLAMMPSARAKGLGQSAGGVRPAHVLAAIGLGGIAAVMFLPNLMQAASVMAGMALAQAALAALAMRQIGGQTGDVLGAAQQMAVLAGWLVLAAQL
jgi:adenosylcobinamide-GDP ribazoletransferase